MQIFLTGASGFIGSAILTELLNAGHQVTALARSAEQAKKLESAGARTHMGDLDDHASMRKGAENADGVIHTAFNHDFSRYAQSCENDRLIIRAFGEALAGSSRPVLITSGIGLLPSGRLVNEHDQVIAGKNPRTASEEAVFEIASKGVHASLIRLPPTVHGVGDHGFVPMLIDFAQKQGSSVYIGEGQNFWPAVHRFDAAKLYRLAVETSADPATVFHGVAEEGIAFKEIAEAIGKGLNLPVVSKLREEAAVHFGFFAYFAAMDVVASAEITKQALGWAPDQIGILEDLEKGTYFQNS
jgi:nucleoside-diphosphate-sugar epimerase